MRFGNLVTAFSALVFALTGSSLAAIQKNSDWASLPESDREVAFHRSSARTSTSLIHQAITAADPGEQDAKAIDADIDALNGTYGFTVPIVDLPGRVGSTKLSFHYRARLWLGFQLGTFDVLDKDSIPGWSISLPKILGGVLIEADGTRRNARKTLVVGNGADDVEVSYLTIDGSNISYQIRLVDRKAYGRILRPDGSVTFMAGYASLNDRGGHSVLYSRLAPTEFVDQSGNVTTLEYQWLDLFFYRTVILKRITDSLGRKIDFNYLPWSPGSAFGHQLSSISRTIGNTQREVLRISYREISAYSSIHPSDSTKDELRKISVVEAMYFPATRRGFWFGEDDSYNQYGTITRFVEQIGMGYVPANNTIPEKIIPGVSASEKVYEYPRTAPITGDRIDFPKYARTVENAAGIQEPIITTYAIGNQGENKFVEVGRQDGSKRKTTVDANTGAPIRVERFDRSGTATSSTLYEYKPDSQGNSRLAAVHTTSPELQRRTTRYSYGADGMLETIRDFDWSSATASVDGALLRYSRSEYYDRADYLNRGLRGLMRRFEVYSPASLTPEERTDYEYDTSRNVEYAGITRNIFSTPGFRPDLLEQMPQGAKSLRGQLTRISRWTNPQDGASSAKVHSEFLYSEAGPLVAENRAGQRLRTLAYSAATSFAFPDSIEYGGFDSPRLRKASTSRYEWNLDHGLAKSVRKPSKGTTEFVYDDAGRTIATKLANGRRAQRLYDADKLAYTEEYWYGNSKRHATSVEFDGKGRPRSVITDDLGSKSVREDFEYDFKGQMSRSSAVRIASDPPTWMTYRYDRADRLEEVQGIDGRKISSVSYGTVTPGETSSYGTSTRIEDAWGRARIINEDALGRIVKIFEPPDDGSDRWTKTGVSYDVRGNIESIQSENNQAGLALLSRRFRYDGLSRLTHKYLNERDARLDDLGNVVDRGTWSDVYRYDGLSNIIGWTDPRGVAIRFDYERNALNRLLRVVSIIPPLSRGQIIGTPTARYFYMRSGNLHRLREMRVDNTYRELYRYDRNSRLSSIVTNFTDRSANYITQNFVRNNFGEPIRIKIGSNPRGNVKEFSLALLYDSSGRRSGFSADSADLRNFSIVATPNDLGQLKSISYSEGAWQALEEFDLAPATGRLQRHFLTVSNTRLFDYTYNYEFTDFPNQQVPIGATGQLLGVLDNLQGQVTKFEYDARKRLTLASTENGAMAFRYRYDKAGNRLQSGVFKITTDPVTGSTVETDLGMDAADGRSSLPFNPLNNRIGAAGYEYDAAGNVTRMTRKDGSAVTLRYDAMNRLAEITEPGNPATRSIFAYSPSNLMVFSRTGSGLAKYTVWRNETESSTFAPEGAALEHFHTSLNLAGRRVAGLGGQVGAIRISYFHGSPAGEVGTTASSSQLRRQHYKPYGGGIEFDEELRFHGYPSAGSNIHYANNRHYDAETARFLQPDPSQEGSFQLSDPQTLNLYAFNRGDPVNRRDPLGLCSTWQIEQVLPDGSSNCIDPVGSSVYETVVHGTREERIPETFFQGSTMWGWNSLVGSGNLVEDPQRVVDEALTEKLKKLREKRERCASANAAFTSVATGYARASANVAMHNFNVKALQYSVIEIGADSIENWFEQRENASIPQAVSAAAGRTAAVKSIQMQYEAAKINQSLVESDRQNALNMMRDAAAARDSACQ